MKVIVEHEEENMYGEGSYYEIKTPKSSVGFSGSMEPEDATLNRDLNDVFKIPAMIREAYEAGKAGEELEFVEETNE